MILKLWRHGHGHRVRVYPAWKHGGYRGVKTSNGQESSKARGAILFKKNQVTWNKQSSQESVSEISAKEDSWNFGYLTAQGSTNVKWFSSTWLPRESLDAENQVSRCRKFKIAWSIKLLEFSSNRVVNEFASPKGIIVACSRAAIPGFYQPRSRPRNNVIIILPQFRAPNSDLMCVAVSSSDHAWARCNTWRVRKWPFLYPPAVSTLFGGQPWNLAGFYYYLIPRETFRVFTLGRIEFVSEWERTVFGYLNWSRHGWPRTP